MKKAIVIFAAAAFSLSLAGCGSKTAEKVESTAAVSEAAVSEAAVSEAAVSEAAVSEAPAVQSAVTAVESVVEAPAAESQVTAVESAVEVPAEGGVMSYADFMAAAVDDEVCVETYVQAKQSWWEDKATVYTENEEGAYFVYNMACSEEDYEKLVPGQKIKVTGYKAEWSGEVEIADATFELEDGNYIAPAVDVTSLLGTDELAEHMNQFVSIKGMTVEACGVSGTESTAEETADSAFLYNWDGSGQQGDDLYFNVSNESGTYTFTVESYLMDKDSEVYKAVENLKVGDKIDLEGFLYWYEGAQPHITSVTAAQ